MPGKTKLVILVAICVALGLRAWFVHRERVRAVKHAESSDQRALEARRVRKSGEKPLLDVIAKYHYLALKQLKRSPLFSSSPAIKPKIVIFDPVKEKLIPWSLQQDLIADRPEDIGTLIAVTESDQLGLLRYVSGLRAYTHHTTLTLIDLETSTIIGEKDFAGADAPFRIDSSSSYVSVTDAMGRLIGYSGLPVDGSKMIQYITQLRRNNRTQSER